ncbi:MAG: gliding motility-associated C-terminal domain-containing protein [Bacteroidia bacterium]|nr:gliding motility-associated C-terminal domain-containing protein [Bacteroidia bacterium]
MKILILIKGLILALLLVAGSGMKAQTYHVNGSASATGSGCYILTPNQPNQTGAVWYNDPLNLNNPFDIDLTMNFGSNSNGADGMVFVLQTVGYNALGNMGEGMGFSGFSPSMGVEFDTFQNQVSASDPSYDHITVFRDGITNHATTTAIIAGPVQALPFISNIKDGNFHKVRISWNPYSDTLKVYFDCIRRIKVHYDIRTLFSTNNVFWGFTGGTGGLYNLQQVCLANDMSMALFSDTTICSGHPIQLGLTGGSNFVWTPDYAISSTTVANPIVNPTVSTMYHVSYKDDCNFTRQDSIYVNVTGASVSLPQNQSVCAGGTLTLDATSPGATSYLWQDNSTNPMLSVTVAGTYSVTVTDTSSCTAIASTTVTQSANGTINIVSQTDVSCFGLNDGSVTVQGNGGTAPYQYSWSNSGAGATLNNLAASTYTVTSTAANGCTANTTVTITQPAVLTVSISNVTNLTCFGSNNGTATAVANGGTQAYNYTWSTAIPQNTATASNLAAGTYTVTVTDQHNCTQTANTTITEPPAVTAVISNIIDAQCGSSTGSATVTAGGGTPGYTYIWNTVPAQTTPTASALAAGNYSVTVSDSHACTAVASVTINQQGGLNAAINSQTDINCFGGNNGTATVSITGGTTPYTYIWNTIPAQTTATATQLTAGSFTVTVTDAGGCSAMATAVITQPQPLLVSATGTNATCYGDNNGSVTLTVSGGVPGYNFLWNNMAATQNLSNIPAGTYSVVVTDANLCTAGNSVVITQPQQIVVTAQNQQICYGTAVTIIPNVSGGTSPYTYYWENIAGTSTLNFIAYTDTVISVYVKDASNCTSNTATVSITVGSPIFFSVSVNKDTVCAGDSVFVGYTVNGGDGGPYTFFNASGQMITFPFMVYPAQTTVYTFMANDNCGATGIDSVKIVTLPQPDALFSADISKGCQPMRVTFNVNTNNPGASCLWDFGDNTASTAMSPVHTFNNPGAYDISLTIISKYGCNGSLVIQDFIEVYRKPEAKFYPKPASVSILDPIVSFFNYSSDAAAYAWTFGDSASSSDASPDHVYSQSGQFLVTLVAISVFGCLDTTTSPVEVKDEATFFAPTAFSPDKNGANDVFRVFASGINLSEFILIIYDRWGEIIYSSADIAAGWDGTVKGKKVSPGTFVWYVKYKDNQGVSAIKTGYVTVVR